MAQSAHVARVSCGTDPGSAPLSHLAYRLGSASVPDSGALIGIHPNTAPGPRTQHMTAAGQLTASVQSGPIMCDVAKLTTPVKCASYSRRCVMRRSAVITVGISATRQRTENWLIDPLARALSRSVR